MAKKQDFGFDIPMEDNTSIFDDRMKILENDDFSASSKSSEKKNKKSSEELEEKVEETEDDDTVSSVKRTDNSDLEEFVKNSKFYKSIKGFSKDKSETTISMSISKRNFDMISVLTNILSKDFGYSKVDITNMIISSFFSKYSNELNEARNLFNDSKAFF